MLHREGEVQLVTIHLEGTVNANSIATFASERIQYPYRVKRLGFFAELGGDNQVEVDLFVSLDGQTPTVALIGQTALVGLLSNVAGLRARGEWLIFDQEIDIDVSHTYVKLHVDNQSGIAQYVQSFVTCARLKKE